MSIFSIQVRIVYDQYLEHDFYLILVCTRIQECQTKIDFFFFVNRHTTNVRLHLNLIQFIYYFHHFHLAFMHIGLEYLATMEVLALA